MVVRVFKPEGEPLISVHRGTVNDYGFGPVGNPPSAPDPAKYHNIDADKSDDPCKQRDLDTWILPADPVTGACNHRNDGY
jgi:hypothetical protein